MSKRLIIFRYTLSAIRTSLYLATARPRSVIVSTPPVFPGLIALGYVRLSGGRLALDAHPASFGLKGDAVTRKLLPLQRFVSRRASVNLVTVQELVDVVESWGGRATIVHEAPPPRAAQASKRRSEHPLVLFVTIFEPDEPLETFLRAAALLRGEADFQLTGDLRKRPEGLEHLIGENVRFIGYLKGDAYLDAVEQADIIVSLTTRPQAVSRVGSEAVYLQRPLVISNTAAARDAFPYASLVDNTPQSIAEGIRDVIRSYDRFAAQAQTAANRQHERWREQVAELSDVLGGVESDPGEATLSQAEPG